MTWRKWLLRLLLAFLVGAAIGVTLAVHVGPGLMIRILEAIGH